MPSKHSAIALNPWFREVEGDEKWETEIWEPRNPSLTKAFIWHEKFRSNRGTIGLREPSGSTGFGRVFPVHGKKRFCIFFGPSPRPGPGPTGLTGRSGPVLLTLGWGACKASGFGVLYFKFAMTNYCLLDLHCFYDMNLVGENLSCFNCNLKVIFLNWTWMFSDEKFVYLLFLISGICLLPWAKVISGSPCSNLRRLWELQGTSLCYHGVNFFPLYALWPFFEHLHVWNNWKPFNI